MPITQIVPTCRVGGDIVRRVFQRRNCVCAVAVCAVLVALGLLPGCVMFEVGVTNPVAGLTTVAVAPFFNLSDERSADGRRFAQAYFTELQKTPGFQVVPVGVVEQAIHDHHLEMNDPHDAVQLATMLGVDAVVVGAVTDYSPYYPPRIGLQVSWYSPRQWQFSPGVPTDEWSRDCVKPRAWWDWWGKPRKTMWPPPQPVCVTAQRSNLDSDPRLAATRRGALGADVTNGHSAPLRVAAKQPDVRAQSPESATGVDSFIPAPMDATAVPFDPSQPLMSYTRMFDGADPRLTARLRDFVELHGDLRSGGWEAYLYRSEDFIRFTSHLMVVEMLQLHGGEAKRRVVLKHRQWR